MIAYSSFVIDVNFSPIFSSTSTPSLPLGTFMWFWSVSLANQLSGQFLICLGQPQKNCPVSDSTFFVRSLEFLIRSFLKIGHSLISRLDKKIKRVDKKNCPISDTGQFSFGRPKKIEKLSRQLVGQRD